MSTTLPPRAVIARNVINGLDAAAHTEAQITTGIAIEFGSLCQLPAQSVESPRMWFIKNHITGLEAWLDIVAEKRVVDRTEIKKLAYNAWLTRYRYAFQPQLINSNSFMRQIGVNDDSTENQSPMVDRVRGIVRQAYCGA